MIREKFHFSHRGASLLRSNLVVKKWGGGAGCQEVSEDTDEKDAEEGEEKYSLPKLYPKILASWLVVCVA